jgi:hypothetical protein
LSDVRRPLWWYAVLMMRALFATILLLVAGAAGAASARVISAEEWARPRDGESLTHLEPLAAAVRDLMAADGSRLLIRYPGGEEGVLWAQELRAWLVALGVASSRIETSPGSARADAVDLWVHQSSGPTP